MHRCACQRQAPTAMPMAMTATASQLPDSAHQTMPSQPRDPMAVAAKHCAQR